MEAHRSYIELLLQTTTEQQISLVQTATHAQVKILVEIAFNLPKLTDLGEHQKFLVYIGNQKHSLRYKKQMLKKHARTFVKAIHQVKDRLLKVLT